ncbi:DNA polymerase delta subunit [Lachnellula occidentalis]|uniref:DNA polymerase delta subunit n=1 Tax=Lachnellula occidentalis TaxID=215460 RepID=A0A8H8S792_9HELO|nr:DNA polymerase delta subunit [Lachnellula occidentalis]
MPATCRSRTSSGPAARGSQKTLSFGPTKASKPSTKKSKLAASPLSKTSNTNNIDIDIDIDQDEDVGGDVGGDVDVDVDVGHMTSEAAIASQRAQEAQRVKKEGPSAEEERARKVSDAQVRRYWKEREAERRAPRIHQGDLGVEEKVLRLWDMSSQYGPAIGIARMKRWVRANKLGLNPPIEVLAVLIKEEDKGNKGSERAYVDELMSSKFVVGDA